LVFFHRIITADYITQNLAVRQFHVQVAIKFEDRTGELVFAPRQYNIAFHLPLYSQKKKNKLVLKLAPYPPDLALSDYFFSPNCKVCSKKPIFSKLKPSITKYHCYLQHSQNDFICFKACEAHMEQYVASGENYFEKDIL
jgi:hypothetical protein